MLRRPKPTDSESELLQEQASFLVSGSSPAATVTRRADKRRGDGASADSDDYDVKTRDVVTIADLPDELPTLTPAPAKKSCSKKQHVRFENEDPEELLDKHDTHISAVLSRIVERDTSAVPVLLPAFTSTAFPKVQHRTTVKNQQTALGSRKSIFARHIAAQKAKTGCGERNDSKGANTLASELGPAQGTTNGPLLVSGQGLGPDSALETLKIHQENQTRLKERTQSEILEEQKLLLAQLDPRLVDFVRSRKVGNAASSTSASIDKSACPDQSLTKNKPPDIRDSAPVSKEVTMDTDEEDEIQSTSHQPISVEQLPIKPEKEWLHMDKLEPEKLEWMQDLPPPRKKATKQAMQARFDFFGILIPPTKDIPTHLGLHHHGEEPELAGYSLQELFLLSRSQLTQQRSLALNTLAHILSKARAGEYTSCLKGSVLASLLDAGLLFLLRFSLDDSVEGVMSAAVRALRALLVSTEDEENLDNTFPWLLGLASFPLVPQLHKEDDEEDEGQKVTEKQKEERQLDHDIAQQDVIKGLLKMQLLQRMRYILEVVRPSPQTVLDVLEILIRIARHSVPAATQILDCPRLMETVMSDFLPCLWSVLTSPTPPSLYGFPVSKAIKLLRVLGSVSRHACARILNNLGGKERLSRFLSVKPSELLLDSRENICCSTEAFRLWAVAASYGQACNLYKDLYPVLMEALQAAHKPCAPSENLIDLELHRLKSLLMLLTQVTHTAGCHQEIQRGLNGSQGTDGLPPPPVTWSNVSGLQPTVMGILKGCIKKLDDPSQRSSTLNLLPSYMIYMGTYYSQLYLQSSFQPVQCLQELETLTTEVLLPLVSHQIFHRIIDSLRSSSVICKAGIGSSATTLPSLPGFGSSTVKITSLLEPETPLPLCTALFYLLDNILTIHQGLTKRFSSLILMDSTLSYLQSCVEATPSVTHASAWILRHEHHFLYLVLRLAHRLVSSHPEVKKHASLFHQAALALLSWLLPGSEYLAYELVSTMIFNQDLIPETCSGGPEAAALAELRLQEMSSHLPSSGPLLSDSLAQLSLIRACYLTHLAYLEPAVITSRERHLGRNQWLFSQLLPELSGPSLPSDWAFLPLISLYERIGVSQGGGLRTESLPDGCVQSLTHCLQWLLVLESFREQALQLVPPVAKLARLVCIFLCSSDIFLEKAVKELMCALLRGLTRPESLEALDLSLPPPGLASFYDLYSALLTQYEAVSFGDSLFGCFILLPLQRRYSVSMRLAVFGEHVSILRSLGVSLEQLPIALEKFTSPAEDSLPLLLLYFRALVTKALRRNWSPVLYVVAVAHLNAFIFSQDAVPQEVETTRRSLLRKTYYLTDEVLRSHLLLFRLPNQNSALGFSTYEQLTPIRACRLQNVIKIKEGND